jgi:hypothetical protein
MWFLFKGTILGNGPCEPPEQFEKVLDFFLGYFERHFDEISKDDVLRRVFSSAPVDEEIKEEFLVPWDEYTKYVQKDDKLVREEEDDTESLAGTLSGNDAKKWKRGNFKTDYFVNNGLIDMEKKLKRIGIKPKISLSKPEK